MPVKPSALNPCGTPIASDKPVLYGVALSPQPTDQHKRKISIEIVGNTTNFREFREKTRAKP